MIHDERICNTPYFIDLQKEYFEQKIILDKWRENNNYSQINNTKPYPKECLYKMIDLLEIMDDVYYYSPYQKGYEETKDNFLSYSS